MDLATPQPGTPLPGVAAAALALAGALALGPAAAVAGTPAVLYGAANGLPQGVAESSLYTIDPGTGAPTLIGPIGFVNVTGMAFLGDGRLVASANGDDAFAKGEGDATAILIEIDPETGAGTLIGEIDNTLDGDCGRIPDLTYDPTTDTLYGYSDNCNEGGPKVVLGGSAFEGLYTIDPDTGAGTLVGPTGYSGGGNGLARDPATGTLYATPFDDESLITVDPGSGAGTEVPGSAGNVPGNVNALAFDPVTGVLYGSRRVSEGPRSGTPGPPAGKGVASHFLVTIDTGDGTTTTVGATATGLDAIVFQPQGEVGGGFIVQEIPTASTWGLLLLGLALTGAALAVMRR